MACQYSSYWVLFKTTSNRLQSIALGAGGSRNLGYDAAGNVVSDNRGGAGYGYGYNAANRMESFAINGVVQAEYVYNALGQQVIRRVVQDSDVFHVVHDLEGNRLAEYQVDEVAGTSTLLREYVWFEGVPVAVVEGDQVYLVRTDHIGRPVFATDMSGTKVWEASYLPFGGVYVSTGENSNLRFPGQWFQSEAGLHQNWMRDYDPTTGRYIQADPLGLVDGASVYGYVVQNPARYVDPRGEFWATLARAAAGALASAGLQYGINKTYGKMNHADAWGCIDAMPMLTGAVVGAQGLGVLGLIFQKPSLLPASIAGTAALNDAAPDVPLNEPECGCEITDLPKWVNFLKNLALI